MADERECASAAGTTAAVIAAVLPRAVGHAEDRASIGTTTDEIRQAGSLAAVLRRVTGASQPDAAISACVPLTHFAAQVTATLPLAARITSLPKLLASLPLMLAFLFGVGVLDLHQPETETCRS